MSDTEKTSAQNVEFLFLASHGLLSPLSAIRWGCNRLKRTDTKNLSKEQLDLLDHVYGSARVLSKLFGSMLLLARNEDGTYTIQSEPLPVYPLLAAEMEEWKKEAGGQAVIVCKEGLTAQTDSAIVEAIIQNILTMFSEAGRNPKELRIEAKYVGEGVEISFSGALDLPFLQSVRTIDNLDETRPIVGGTSGLLMSLSNALVGFIGGRLEMHESEKENYTITLHLSSDM